MEKFSFSTYTLPCGLRIVCAPGRTDAVYLGLAVDAGTRDELPRESGMAHFTEHMSFKGTGRRSARQVISALEGVGGELNAFTGKEETVYYCTCLRQHAARAIDLLLDITLNSTYPDEEMAHEVEVVIDEIESYRDQPSELIFDEFESLLFPEHPLGRNILGDADTLRTFRSADMRRFTQRLYHPGRMVLYVLGNVEPEKVLRAVEKKEAVLMGSKGQGLDEHRQPFLPKEVEVSDHIVREKSTHQAHVIVGAQAFAASDPRHLNLYFLSNMLGGPAMSSRLNLALRERNGLVYTVESNSVCYTDTGFWSVYYGCDARDRARCRRLVLRELDKLMQSPMSQRTLDAARRQLKGQIGISYDNFENVAIGMAKRYLHYGKTLTKAQLFERLDALTPDDLLQTAQHVFSPDRLLTLEYV
ncbi:MAG: insulinase family protein [Bacteroidaceae bacterium]|nr:insulinase family protein [Bacteroidaceae bacterium]